MNRQLCYTVFFLTIVFVTVPGKAKSEYNDREIISTIQSASELDYPPFSIIRKDGTADGFSVELLSAVSRSSGRKVVFTTGPWKEIKQKLIDGHLDVLPLVSYSKERDEVLDFSTPYLRMHGTIFVRKDEKSIHTEADLKNKEVLVMEGDTAHEYAISKKISNKLILKDSFEEAMTDLSEGKHDALIIQQLVGFQLMKKLNINNIKDISFVKQSDFKPVSRPLSGFEQKICFAVPEGKKELLSLLNEGLSLTIADGTFDDLYHKWFGPILPQPPVKFVTIAKYLFYILAPTLLFLSILGIWFLRRTVVKKTKYLVNEIKERELAKEALRKSEIQLRTLVKAIPDLVWLKDKEGAYLSCNPVFERFFGSKESEIVGKSDYDFVDSALADFFCENDRMAMESHRPHMNEEWLTFSDDGYTGLFETIKTPVIDENDQLIGVLGVARDITERQKSEDALKENEQRYKSAQRMGKVGNWEYDLETENFWGSDEAKRIYGFNPESDLFTIHEVEKCIPDQERVHQALMELIEKNKPYDIEFEIQPVSGAKRKIIRSIAEIKRDDAGVPGKVTGVIQDITQRKKEEEATIKLEQQYRQAQKMESVGRLAGGVAHDYNNALSVIIGFTELAMDQIDPTDPLREYLDEILLAAKRAADITRQLLSFARKQTISPQVLNLNENVETLLKMLRRLIGEDIDLMWLPAKNLWTIKMDPSQIDQLLVNLCVNARDAIDGVGKITIETNTAIFDSGYCATHTGFVPGEYVMLAVSDNGCGMDKEILNNIFEPFFTTKAVDKGTGLGLSTVYGIVKQNNGFINIYSEPGKGTTIKLYMARHEGSAITALENSIEAVPKGHGETILIVEDDPSILKLAEQILARERYTLLTADTPKGAINLVKRHAEKIDLLVTDVIMPEMNGLELTNNLKSDFPDIKAVFMSGYTATAIEHHGVLDEGIHFIQKPFSKIELASMVRKVLDGAKNCTRG